ncbi:hypothetical protein CMI47_01975 [Candidatus Pacearchaeota archaeon]|nr:hypothetical protein [Candidatus Pacearchaeota archaeon]|tara:strand:- start:68 stop:1147 length:1080 start_codon:yes stop_codon:yes gene_type:complete
MEKKTVVLRWYPSLFRKKKKNFMAMILPILSSRGYSLDFVDINDKEISKWDTLLKKYKHIITWDGVSCKKNVKDYHNILYFQPQKFHRFSKRFNERLDFHFDNDGFGKNSSLTKAYQKEIGESGHAYIKKKLNKALGNRDKWINNKKRQLLFMMHTTKEYWNDDLQSIMNKLIDDCKKHEYDIIMRPHPMFINYERESNKKGYQDFVKKMLTYSKDNSYVKVSTSDNDIRTCEFAITVMSTAILTPAWFGAKCCSIYDNITGNCNAIHSLGRRFFSKEKNLIEELREREYSEENLMRFLHSMHINTNSLKMNDLEFLSIPAIKKWVGRLSEEDEINSVKEKKKKKKKTRKKKDRSIQLG